MPVDHLPGGDEVKGSCPCWARRSALRHDAVEKALDIAERYVAREKGFSQPAREQEGQLAAFHLLVVRHVPDERRAIGGDPGITRMGRSEEHTSELQSLMRISYAVFCLKKTTTITTQQQI